MITMNYCHNGQTTVMNNKSKNTRLYPARNLPASYKMSKGTKIVAFLLYIPRQYIINYHVYNVSQI